MATDLSGRRAIYVQRYASHLAQEFQTLFSAIRANLAGGLLDKQVTEALLSQLEATQAQVMQKLERDLISNLQAFAQDEMEFEVLAAMREHGVKLMTPPNIWGQLTASPMIFQGINDAVSLEAFIKDWTESQVKRVTGIIRAGALTGKSNAEIIKDVAAYHKKTSLRTLEAIVRTATNHISSEAKQAVYQANADIVVGYEWKSVLDDRTSDICMSLDGTKYYYKDNPTVKPPAHPNCRSTTKAVLDPKFL